MSAEAAWDTRGLRLRSVRDRLHDLRLDALLVSHLPSIRWLSGFTGSSAFLLVEPGSATLITDFRYRTQASEEVCDGVSISIFICSRPVGQRLTSLIPSESSLRSYSAAQGTEGELPTHREMVMRPEADRAFVKERRRSRARALPVERKRES